MNQYQQPQVEVEEENGNIDKIISIAPIVLDVELESVKRVGIYYLPFSTGFEIECDLKSDYNIEDFKLIPDLMHCDINSNEQRFRIPKGIEGINALYSISIALRKNCLLTDSGIHYHIDFTDVYDKLNKEFIDRQANWILEELDTWNYKGSYNRRDCIFNYGAVWVRFQDGFKTMEIRIGEMTFDYELLFKRITHANKIARKLKALSEAETNPIILYDDDIESIIRNRVKTI